jgi:hypothetical protein
LHVEFSSWWAVTETAQTNKTNTNSNAKQDENKQETIKLALLNPFMFKRKCQAVRLSIVIPTGAVAEDSLHEGDWLEEYENIAEGEMFRTGTWMLDVSIWNIY